MDPPEPPRHAVLIANPVSGGGSGRTVAEQAMAALGRRHVAVDLRYTQSAGDAERLAREAVADGADLLLALGGDGTIRDVAVGLGDSGVPLALLPAGTGNDHIPTHRLPSDLEEALVIALQGRDLPRDLWLWNERPFLNVAGFGIDAATAAVVNTKLFALRGALAYLVGLVITLPSYQPLPITLRWECCGNASEWNGRAWLCAFANGKFYGGGMRIAPEAEPDDGLLDIVIVEDVAKGELLQQLPGLFSGRHVMHPRVKVFRAERLQVEAPQHVVSLDGELYEGPPAVITRAPYSVNVRTLHHPA
jgi:YegS/Rv2252/BmrU family lipid kinase